MVSVNLHVTVQGATGSFQCLGGMRATVGPKTQAEPVPPPLADFDVTSKALVINKIVAIHHGVGNDRPGRQFNWGKRRVWFAISGLNQPLCCLFVFRE